MRPLRCGEDGECEHYFATIYFPVFCMSIPCTVEGLSPELETWLIVGPVVCEKELFEEQHNLPVCNDLSVNFSPNIERLDLK